MNIRALLLTVFVLLHLQGTAQTRNDVWALGDSILLEMGPEGFEFSRTIPFYAEEGVTSICDTVGKLLFYASNTTAYNRFDDTLLNGGELTIGPTTLVQGCMTVPVPTVPEHYYLFTLEKGIGSRNSLFVSRIDMGMDGGKGGVLPGFKSRLLTDNVGEMLQIVRHGNGQDWWVLVRPLKVDSISRTQGFLRFWATSDSIVGPWFQDIGRSNGTMGEIAVAPDGSKLATCASSSNLIQVFSFDRCLGIVNEEKLIYDSMGNDYFGVVFGPESKVIYGIRGAPRVVNQFFPREGGYNQHEIVRYGTILSQFLGPPELGPDGRIYIANATFGAQEDTSTKYLGTIREPVLEGAACEYDTFGVWLGGAFYQSYALPNQVNFNLGVLEGSPCDTTVASIPPMVESSEAWSAYPNPFQDRICLESLRSAQPDQVALFDIAGRLVWEQTSSASTTGTTHCYTVSQTLATGTYTLHIQTGNTAEVLRVEAAGH